MIQEIVFNGVRIVRQIDVDAPTLKIVTLDDVRLNRELIDLVAPALKMFSLRVQ